MAREIERKFLVTGDGWRDGATRRIAIRQFYLARTPGITLRVRLKEEAGETRAVLTIKGTKAGASRLEYEYPIPLAEARAMEALAEGAVIEKVRHVVPQGDLAWEVDVFAQPRTMVVAEIELPEEGTAFDRPDWIGGEVTDDPTYYNAAIALGR